MLLEPLVLVARWLARPDYGVNAALERLVALAPEGPPVPPVRFIGTPVGDECVANWEEPPAAPALYVTLDGPAQASGEVATNYRQADRVLVAVRVLSRASDARVASRQTLVHLRAIVGSLRELHRNEHAEARTLNGVRLQVAATLEYGELAEEVGESCQVTGAVVVGYDVRDTQPTLFPPPTS